MDFFSPRFHLIFLTAASIVLVLLLGMLASAGVVREVVPVSDFGELQSRFSEADLQYFSDALADADIAEQPGEQQLIDVMRWVMNNVTEVGSPVSKNPVEIFESGRALCGGMSLVFSAAAQSRGYVTREVDLIASPGNLYDTHVLTEVKVDGEWLIFDPTFNLTFVDSDNRKLGVSEVQRSIYRTSVPLATPVFHGDVAYPARLETYPIDWQIHFASAYAFPKTLVETARSSVVSKFSFLPVYGYFFGAKKYYLAPDGQSHRYQKVFNAAYFLAMLLLPVLMMVSASLLAFGLLTGRKLRRKTAPSPASQEY